MRLTMIVSALALLGAALAGPGPALAGGYRVEYSFGPPTNGASPSGDLLVFGGKLYGTTTAGGALSARSCKLSSSYGGCGTVFSFDPHTGAQTVLYAFTAEDGDGAEPVGRLIELNGKLNGATLAGGCPTSCHYTLRNAGTVYSIDPASGADKVLYVFQGGADGANPYSAFIEVGGLLYGTASTGGVSANCPDGLGCGTVFSLDPATGAFAVVHKFTNGDGANPIGGLIEVGDVLYGTTSHGGEPLAHLCPAGCGVVFSLQPASGAEAVVYAFQGGKDAMVPMSDLIGVGGLLYGTTEFVYSEKHGVPSGTVFSVDPATGAEAVVHAFKQSAGGLGPGGGLAAIGGAFYGTTLGGGAESCSCGALYKMHP